MKNSCQKICKYEDRGFTLIELLLVVALLAGVAGFTVPILQSSLVRSNFENSTLTVVNAVQRTQILSQSMTGDKKYGIHIGDGKVTIFKGSSYNRRNTSEDEISFIEKTISVSGLTLIKFAKLSGYPKHTGTIKLISVLGDVNNIEINKYGVIEY